MRARNAAARSRVMSSAHYWSHCRLRPSFFSFMVDELERFFAGHETLFDITPSTLANGRGLAAKELEREWLNVFPSL